MRWELGQELAQAQKCSANTEGLQGHVQPRIPWESPSQQESLNVLCCSHVTVLPKRQQRKEKNRLQIFFKSKLPAAAAAKSLLSCPTLCDPIDVSPPGSPAPGILHARTLEWVAISFSMKKKKRYKIKTKSTTNSDEVGLECVLRFCISS